MATTEQEKQKSSDTTGSGARGRSGAAGLSNFQTIAGATAAGAVLGVLAMIGRKAVVQAPTFLAGDWDEALAAEHQATLKVFDALEATDETSTTKRGALLANLKHMLAKHAMEEENVIYPALRDAGEKEAADHLNADHGYVKQYLYELDMMPNSSPAFLTTLRKFRTDIETHMREEEDELFPRLKAKLTPEKTAQLTKAMNKEGFKLA